jgi:hypothetical protein
MIQSTAYSLSPTTIPFSVIPEIPLVSAQSTRVTLRLLKAAVVVDVDCGGGALEDVEVACGGGEVGDRLDLKGERGREPGDQQKHEIVKTNSGCSGSDDPDSLVLELTSSKMMSRLDGSSRR